MNRNTRHVGPANERSYSVYTKFRRTRLAMLRRVTAERAFDFAAQLRRDRFHDPEAIFVVDDLTDQPVERPVGPEEAEATLPVQSEPEAEAAEVAEEPLLVRGTRCYTEAAVRLNTLSSNLQRLKQLVAQAHHAGETLPLRH